jgi:protein-tyrosine phosphatase
LDLSEQRARKVSAADIEAFDYILVMDHSNLYDLEDLVAESQRERVNLFMHFSERWDVDEVPDPYYGGDSGFERVLDMVEDAAAGLLMHIRRHHW